MSPFDWRSYGLLFVPVSAVFAVLAAVGLLPPGPATLGALFALGGVGLGVARIRERLTESQQIDSVNEAELHAEFVHQSRLAESYETILDAIPSRCWC